MSTFNKIYKKNTGNTYDEVSSVSDVNGDEIHVFGGCRTIDRGGLIPTPPKSSYNKYLSGMDGWNSVSFHGYSHDDTYGFYLYSGLDNSNKLTENDIDAGWMWEHRIPADNLITREEYNKIENIKGGYSLLDSNHKAYIDGQYYENYQKLYGNIMSAYTGNSATVNIGTSGYSAVATMDAEETSRERLTYDFASMCTMVNNDNVDTMDGHGIPIQVRKTKSGIQFYNKSIDTILLAATFRVAVKSNTKGYMCEICPYVNGSRSASQAFQIYSGGNFFNTYVVTYLFDISHDNTSQTVIELYSKASNGSLTLQITDANFTVLNAPDSYFLVNDTTPSKRNTI